MTSHLKSSWVTCARTILREHFHGSPDAPSQSIGLIAMFAVLSAAADATACTICDSSTGWEVRQEIMREQFMLRFLWMLVPFGLFGSMAAWLHGCFPRLLPGLRARYGLQSMGPLISASLLLGVGLGGFFDGIVFHQILQMHNMISARVFPDTLVKADVNMFWDGIFHMFCYIATGTGLGMLWRCIERDSTHCPRAAFVGGLMFGAGFFNLVEGLIDHHLLELHHVIERAKPGVQGMVDAAFLVSGVVLMGIGAKKWLNAVGSQPGLAR